jgi:uncharacterized protein (DUF2235 family)
MAAPHREVRMPKRLVICCDGTWNTPDEFDETGQAVSTNVTKLAFAVKERDSKGMEQRTFYGRGVGTGRFDHWIGGALGVGLSQRILEAYRYVVENYEPNDELFITGFSRGAYTARSLAGFIRNSGVLRRQYTHRLDAAFDLYRDRSPGTHPRSREATLFRRTYSFQPTITFIGVWDTVGSLGIPELPVPAAISDHWKFHDVGLSTHVQYAFHALALDERRKPFVPTLWDQDDNAPDWQVLRQTWFVGVHSDIGGGYAQTGLSDIALAWLMARAQACGLALDPSLVPATTRPDVCGPLHNSMTRAYALLGESIRDLPERRLRADGSPMRTNEWVASTAQRRWDLDPSYRPVNVGDYLRRGGRIEDVPVLGPGETG